MTGTLFIAAGAAFVVSLLLLGLDVVENQGRSQASRTTRWVSWSLVAGFITCILFIAGFVSAVIPLLKGWIL